METTMDLELKVLRSGCDDVLISPTHAACSVGSFKAQAMRELHLDARWEWDVVAAGRALDDDAQPLLDSCDTGGGYPSAASPSSAPELTLRPKYKYVARERLREWAPEVAEALLVTDATTPGTPEGTPAASSPPSAPTSPPHVDAIADALRAAPADVLQLVLDADVLSLHQLAATCARYARDGDIAALQKMCHCRGGAGASSEAATWPRCVLNATGADDAGRTPLMHAAAAGRMEMCRLLIAHGADVGVRCARGATAVWWAAEGGHADVCQWLMGCDGFDRGCLDDDIDGRGTCLMRAVIHGDAALATMLLRADVARNAPCQPEGFTPLYAAVYAGRKRLCTVLLSHGADANAPCADGRLSLEAVPPGDTAMDQLLRQYGAVDTGGLGGLGLCSVQ